MNKLMNDRLKEIIPILKEYKIKNAFIGCFQGKGIDPNEHLMIYITAENIKYEFLQTKRKELLKEKRVPELFVYELDKILTYELEDKLNISIEITIVPTNYAKQLYSYQDKMPCIILINDNDIIDDYKLEQQINNFENGIKSVPDMLIKNFIPNIFATLAFSIPRIEYISTLQNFLDPELHMKSKYVFAMRDRVLQDYFRAYKDIVSISKYTDFGGIEFYKKRCSILDEYCRIAKTNCLRKMIGEEPFKINLSDEILTFVWEDHQNMKDYALECVNRIREMRKSYNAASDEVGDAIDFIDACKQNKNGFLKQELDIYEKRLGEKKIANREQFKRILA